MYPQTRTWENSLASASCCRKVSIDIFPSWQIHPTAVCCRPNRVIQFPHPPGDTEGQASHWKMSVGMILSALPVLLLHATTHLRLLGMITVILWPQTDILAHGHDTRGKKKGQAEKDMDGQHCWVDREELCHDPSPWPWPSEVETGKSFAMTQALALDRQRWRQGRALPWPKPLPETVRGGDSWCSVHQCSAPTIPGRLKGLVIVIVIFLSWSAVLVVVVVFFLLETVWASLLCEYGQSC